MDDRREKRRAEPRHPIRVASERTGLSPHVLRAWERRYGVVKPDRTEGGHRLYSDPEIRRLRLLQLLTEGGRRIGQIAELDTPGLEALLREDRREGGRTIPDGEVPGGAAAPSRWDRPDGTAGPAGREGGSESLRAFGPTGAGRSGPPPASDDLLEEALAAVDRYDDEALEQLFRGAALDLSVPVLVDELVTPLLRRVGADWERGELRPGQEHLVSEILTRTLHWLIDSFDGRRGAPRIVLGTPAGQRHELGALIAAATAAAEGWHPLYLGPDLPGEEVASAARRTGARAVALSLIHPAGSRAVARELRVLRDRLPPEVPVLVGGAAVDSYHEPLGEICAFRLGGFDDLREALRLLSGT